MNWYNHSGKQFIIMLKVIKMFIIFDLIMALLGIYPTEINVRKKGPLYSKKIQPSTLRGRKR